jgi:hypothetical protein
MLVAVIGLALLGAACDVPPATPDEPAQPPATAEPSENDTNPRSESEPADPERGVNSSEQPAEDPGATAADYPGMPAPGTVGWGANTRTDERLEFHESEAGHALSLHRSFFQWHHRTANYMLSTVEADLEASRLPWVSFKTPRWNDMAAGKHDAEIDALLTALDAQDGPVWLTIHHEPEGGAGVNRPDDPAGPAAHVAMNRRVRQRMTALGTDNIALAPILMSYTWDRRSGRNPDQWFAPGIYDFIGVDHYIHSERSLLTSVWADVRVWAGDRDLDLAVGEWGMVGTNAAAGRRLRAWYDHAAGSHDDGAGARVIGLSAFEGNPGAEPTGRRIWFLEGEQLKMFHQLLNDPRTAVIGSD